MRSPDTAFQTAIAEGSVKVAELYIIELSNGTSFYYTNHSEDIDWDSPSVSYVSIPITRSAINTNVSLENSGVVLSLANITGDLYSLVQKNVLDGAKVTIKRILWNEAYASGMEITVFIGTADVEFTRKELFLKCTTIINSLNIVVPRRMYQEPCNNRLGDVSCGVTRSGYKFDGVADSDSTDYFTVNDTIVDPTYYELGEIEMTSGNNDGCRRPILSATTAIITTMWPFPNLVLTGDTFTIYYGCDKTAAVCESRFDNTKNFNGFIYIPKVEETIM